jgi:hypothetical protein
MRIRLSDASNGDNATPCGTSTYGEVEDYSLNVKINSTDIIENEKPIESNGIASEQFLVFPNPSQGEIQITSQHKGDYYLINEAGQLVQRFQLNADNKYSYRIENLASGMYIVSGQNKYGVVKQKVLVIH